MNDIKKRLHTEKILATSKKECTHRKGISDIKEIVHTEKMAPVQPITRSPPIPLHDTYRQMQKMMFSKTEWIHNVLGTTPGVARTQH
jgi:hypothetical protein